MHRTLNVYYNGSPIGVLTEINGKKLHFKYHDNVRFPISLSMPISKDMYDSKTTTAFFENLLPEGDILNIISRIYNVSKRNPFSLLTKIGEDCAGTISVTNNDLNLENYDLEKLTIDQLKLQLNNNLEGKTPYTKGARLSIAGVQAKTTIIYDNNTMFIPSFKYPSTHIIKFINKNFNNILSNELYCTNLAKKIDLVTSNMELIHLDQYEYLKIERFDRKNINGNIERLYQEDILQVLSIPSNSKYQNEGGPSFKILSNLIDQYFYDKAKERIKLAKILVYNLLIGNCDYHGKNFSVKYEDNKYSFTPFYDLVSTICYPDLTTNMAMYINKVRDINLVTKDDVIKEFNSWNLNGEKLLQLIMRDFKNILQEAKDLSNEPIYINAKDEINKIIDFIKIQYNKLL